MSKRLIITRLLFCVSFVISLVSSKVYSNRLYEDIQQERSIGSQFKEITRPGRLTDVKSQYSKSFKNIREVSFLSFDANVAASLTRTIATEIITNTGNFKLELVEVNEDFYDYFVTTSDGRKQKSNTSYRHYRGIANGDPNSVVAISFFEGQVMGVISNATGNYNLAYDEVSRSHIFYKDNNLISKSDFACHTSAKKDIMYDKELTGARMMSFPSEGKCVKLYIETEVDIFTNRGSVANVESFVAGLFNQVATLYYIEKINIVLSQVFVWTSTDPYTEDDPDLHLGQFQSTRTSINGDLGHLLTFRVLGGNAGGIDGLCNPSVSKRLAIVGINTTVNPVPSHSFTVTAVTHELGHQLGSEHTHACVWNGNNTAIDGCSLPEGGCSTGPIPAGGGTIMSYCHLNSVGVNLALGFGPQPGNVIRNKVSTASCLCSCCPYISGPDMICTTGSFVANNVPSGATVTWASSNTSILTINSSSGAATRVGSARGEIIVSATYTGVSGSLVRLRRTIYVGAPTYIMSIDGINTTAAVVYPGGLYGLNAQTLSPGVTNYTYTDFSGSGDMSISLVPSGAFSYAVVSGSSTSGHREIVVQGTNVCGSINQNIFLYLAGAFKLYPNPAKSDLTLEFPDVQVREALPLQMTLLSEVSNSVVKTVSVRDYFDKKLFKDGNKIVLDVSQLPRGTYYLHVRYDKSQDNRTEKIRILLD